MRNLKTNTENIILDGLKKRGWIGWLLELWSKSSNLTEYPFRGYYRPNKSLKGWYYEIFESDELCSPYYADALYCFTGQTG